MRNIKRELDFKEKWRACESKRWGESTKEILKLKEIRRNRQKTLNKRKRKREGHMTEGERGKERKKEREKESSGVKRKKI